MFRKTRKPRAVSDSASGTKAGFWMTPTSHGVVAVTVGERLLGASNSAISPEAKKPGMVRTLDGFSGFSAGGGSFDSRRTMAFRAWWKPSEPLTYRVFDTST